MPIYIDKNLNLHAFDDTAPPELVAQAIAERGLVPATPEQVQTIQNPVPTAEQLAAAARAKRNGLLVELDALCAPLRWETYTDAYKEALRTYRIALLDVPQKDGFPHTIKWPDKP
jgi:hypothetical protein